MIQVCRCALDRAKRKGVLATVQRAPATDLENPNFELLRHEAARLVTFTNFPDNSPVTPSTLAKAGFFHKGPGDDNVVYFTLMVEWCIWNFYNSSMYDHF